MKISDDCFADITLGLTFDETKIDETKKVLQKKKIPLYKIEKVPRKFKLSRKKDLLKIKKPLISERLFQ